jgi:hypothetical protein
MTAIEGQEIVSSTGRRRICMVSGADEIRLRSYIGHTIYCQLHDIDYRLQCTITEGVADRFLLKQAAVLRVLDHYDWVMWVDDDCYVTDFDRNIVHELVEQAEAESKSLIIAPGVKEPQGFWSYINAGVFIVKNDTRGREFLQRTMATDGELVREWWDAERHGMFNGGYDQDVMTWLLDEEGYAESTLWADHRDLNSRIHYYESSPRDAFICHFAGFWDKKLGVAQFADRFDLGQELVPERLLDQFHVVVRDPMGKQERAAREIVLRAAGFTKSRLAPIRPLIQPAVRVLKRRLA